MLSGKKMAQVSERRESGYKRALEKHGFRVREEWIVDCQFDQSTAMQKAMELKRRYPGIDAFFCASDGIAIGAIDGMMQLGMQVPQDVAVAGFDDFTVSSTTVFIGYPQCGHETALSLTCSSHSGHSINIITKPFQLIFMNLPYKVIYHRVY